MSEENDRDMIVVDMVGQSFKSTMKVLLAMFICGALLMTAYTVLIFVVNTHATMMILDRQAVIEHKLDNQNALLVQVAAELAKARIETNEAEIQRLQAGEGE